MDFEPHHWFWRADDGRVFSSASMGLVADDDPSFTAFVERMGSTPRWPADDDGNQTQAALDVVLVYYALKTPDPAEEPVITYKADLYRRCTDEEADAIEMALASAPTRQRRLFESAQFLKSDDPDFDLMREAMVGMFGQARTDELLAASEAVA